MEVEATLAVLAEIAIAIAGFSGIVAALSRRTESEWTALDRIRLGMLLQISLVGALFSLLPWFSILQTSTSRISGGSPAAAGSPIWR